VENFRNLTSDISKPRILVIENSIEVTGALKSITRTAYDLREFFEFQFILPKKSRGRSWVEKLGFTEIHELPMIEISKRFSSLLFYVPFLVFNTISLLKIVRREKVVLIHVNDLYNLLPVLLCIMGIKVPYVCHIRFMPDRFPKWLFNFWFRLHLRYARYIVVVSQSLKNMLPAHPKLVLIHNELPIDERYPDFKKPINKTSKYFLYLSNIIEGKGQNYALEVFAKIHESLPDWKLRFVGSDMGLLKNKIYKDALKFRSNSLDVSNKIEWAEFTDDVESEYKHADIVLNFSESESFSITCLEALYYGRPLIATDCGGPAEIIDHMESGWLVKNRDTEEMADAMLSLATDELLRERFAKQGRVRSREKFSVEKTSLRLRELYNSVILK
jgi:glycosyltransferase involved in cell wall biosynthesis